MPSSTFPSEIVTFSDPVTSRRVRQLTNFKCNHHHFYFTNPGWWDGGRKLLISGDRFGRTNLFSVDLESGEITQHTDKDLPGPPCDTPFLFACVNPERPECYFWRGRDLVAIELLTNRERVLWKCPDAYLPNITSASSGGAYVYTVVTEDLSSRMTLNFTQGYVGFDEYFEAHPHSQIVRVAVDSGRAEVVWAEHEWINHVNASPTRPELISFCHEGHWQRVESRIWMLDVDRSKARPVRPRQKPGELIGHEYWYADGETLGYHGDFPGVGGVFGSVRYDNTGVVEIPGSGQTGHIHSLDFSMVVGDAQPYLRVWGQKEGTFGKPRMLCRHDGTFKTQQLHVHPRVSPDGKTVVFTSDRTGYGQVYEVEIGDWNDLPEIEVP